MRQIRASYRLQLHATCNLHAARALVPYLQRLGVSHVYCSPVFRARGGSTHGYDVVDPTELNPELGTDDDWRDLVDTAHHAGMGLLIDIVPNHMATGAENPFWDDVLRHGRSSPCASWFDIDWRAPDAQPGGRVLVPVLGARRSVVLDRGELRLGFASGEFRISYYEHTFPVDPATIGPVLDLAIDEVRRAPVDAGVVVELDAIRREAAQIPSRRARSTRRRGARVASSSAVRARLRALAERDPDTRRALDAAAVGFGDGLEGRARLETLLAAQAYRLVFWRRAAREVNYRRFFDINELISIRQEDPEVFGATHRKVLEWVGAGAIDGLRIDHVDGLRDPRSYLERLAEAVHARAPHGAQLPVYVEKILSGDERLPSTWPVAGTTGYDFLNDLEAVFMVPDGARAVEEWYCRAMGRPAGFEEASYAGRRRVLAGGLAVHKRRLARRLRALAERSVTDTHLASADLLVAVTELLAHFPVYRTYCDGRTPTLRDEGRAAVLEAVGRAEAHGRARPEALAFLRDVLLLAGPAAASPDARRDAVRFVERFQQASVSVMAKGVEDTAFYAYVPLVSRNEVGSAPGSDLEGALARFHQRSTWRATHWPATLLAVSTHDTKRSADARARLDVLSEVPAEWIRRVRRWRRRNRGHRVKARGRYAPDPSMEYHFYQALVAVWPLPVARALDDSGCLEELRARMESYMLKAAREAKERTSWRDPDSDYEAALRRFVGEALSVERSGEFLAEVGELVELIARPGLWNGLARTIMHLTAPGVPDIYQGDELWDFSLVDPDNRRPVAFAERARMLDELSHMWHGGGRARRQLLSRLVDEPEDGLIKLHTIQAALGARARAPDLFVGGAYEQLSVTGARSEHVVAFARRRQRELAVAIAPRWTVALLESAAGNERADAPIGTSIWRDTSVRLTDVPMRLRLVDVLTGVEVLHGGDQDEIELPVGDVLTTFPVALLLGREEG